MAVGFYWLFNVICNYWSSSYAGQGFKVSGKLCWAVLGVQEHPSADWWLHPMEMFSFCPWSIPLRNSVSAHPSLSSCSLGTAHDLLSHQWALSEISFGFHILFPNLQPMMYKSLNLGSFKMLDSPCTKFKMENTQSPHYTFFKGNKMLQGLALIKQTSTFLNIVPSCLIFSLSWKILNYLKQLARTCSWETHLKQDVNRLYYKTELNFEV